MSNLARAVFFLAVSGEDAARVDTSFGTLIGKRRTLHRCHEFLGVPYAKAPRRFEDPEAWLEPYPAEGRQAVKHGAVCPQLIFPGLPPAGDEDCLFLNIWTPTHAESLPAMVFIHGGGFFGGAGVASVLGPVPEPLNLYNGCQMAAHQQVLVITLNYRLGVFGFAAFQDGAGNSANFGMKDQRQALRWLRQELSAFGGDPGKVTIFGESAGGMSVFYHVASPVSKGLFRGAISESGFPTAWGWDYSVNYTRRFAANVSCADSTSIKACLQGLPVENLTLSEINVAGPFDMQTAQPPWQPTVDGVDMPRYPMALFKDKLTNGVPMLAGSNTNETNLFLMPMSKPWDETYFEEFLPHLLSEHDPIKDLTPQEMSEARAAYTDYDTSTDKRALASQMTTESSFECGTRLSGQVYSNDFWLYRFNHRSRLCVLNTLIPGVYHTSELHYVFGAELKLGCIMSPEEARLSERMQKMWANFAKCLDPTCGAAGCPKYDNASRQTLVLQTPADVVKSDPDTCELWDRLLWSKYQGATGGPSHKVVGILV
jgi:para-nitrobenzyl esterase